MVCCFYSCFFIEDIFNPDNGVNPIEKDVLERLIGYVTQVGEGAPCATKEFTVFQDFLDETPTFRSYLLQLVLRFGGGAAMNLLGKYLEQADQLLQTVEDANAVRTELHNMIVRCIEQTYWFSARSGRDKA